MYKQCGFEVITGAINIETSALFGPDLTRYHLVFKALPIIHVVSDFNEARL